MDRDTALKALAGLRLAVGAISYAAPNAGGKLFGLEPAANPQAPYLGRLFGVRDVALAVGTLRARKKDRDNWIELGIVCDAADTAAAFMGGSKGYLSPTTDRAGRRAGDRGDGARRVRPDQLTPLDCTYRLQVPHRIGSLARVTATIAESEGLIGEVRTIAVARREAIREITVEVRDLGPRGVAVPRPRASSRAWRSSGTTTARSSPTRAASCASSRSRRSATTRTCATSTRRASRGSARRSPSTPSSRRASRRSGGRSRSSPTGRACSGSATSGRSRRCR